MVANAQRAPQQLPLLHIVERDDVYLAHAEDVEWFRRLRDLQWEPWLPVAAQYYEALWLFNQEQVRGRAQKAAAVPNTETRAAATLRLVTARATEDASAPVIAPPAPAPLAVAHVVSLSLRPGVVPARLAGRPPKCFFAMAKAFLGVLLRGRPAEPEIVHDELVSNPAFARTCGFTLPGAKPLDPRVEPASSDVPSLRKLEQFDQIMTACGLWDRLALDAVRANLASGKLEKGATLVHDTTHHEAHSQRTAVELPAKTEGGKPRKKSHPKTTKNCRCDDRRICSHPWISADAGAGTVVKTGGVMHWAHKASTLCFAGQGVLLDAVAMTDAATHDSRSVEPHLARLFARLPELTGVVKRLLDDGAADDKALKDQVKTDFDVELLTPQNPRQRKALTNDLPRGIAKITPTGTPVCIAGFPMDLLGCRHTSGHFLFAAPNGDDGRPVCEGCPLTLKARCCQPGTQRRHASVAFERLPWIDPKMPQLSQRFATAMAARTVIERVHNLMKHVYGEPRLRRRGTASAQATLDKTLWAMHVVLAQT
jgi:hypothetical protein